MKKLLYGSNINKNKGQKQEIFYFFIKLKKISLFLLGLMEL